MQSKGAIRFLAIIIGLACIFQLLFTLVTSSVEKKAAKSAEQAVTTAKQAASFSAISANDQAFYLDSVRTSANKIYLDSVRNEKVFLGYTYKEVKEKEINLGLDLKGGMNVTLQLDLAELVRSCARTKTTAEFEDVMSIAREKAANTHVDFITLFADTWAEKYPNKQMYFDIDVSKLSGETSNKVNPSNDEIIKYLEQEAESAIDNSYTVVERRVNQFGVAQPNIQKIARTGRILVELPGVKEPERVRKLLQGTASLEFWQTYTYQEILPYLQELNAAAREQIASQDKEEVEAETDTATSELEALAVEAATQNNAAYADANPLFSKLQNLGGNSACLGIAHYRDTAAINAMFAQLNVAFPGDFVPAWSFKAFSSPGVAPDTYFELVALKSIAGKGAVLDGSVITSARVNYNQMSGAAEVSMTMNATGSGKWETITEQNIGHQIAIVMDGSVYSYPNVQNKISGGSSQITGNFTQAEADDLATVLKSGKLSTPARIVQEQVVGPSLGSASINAGMISFLIAFLCILIYMVIFYRGAGLVADVALLCNVLFLFGSLVSFGAVLTLPGIAGLVLTMGMAVDANVIIYERVKEELNAGKALRLAIHDGYKNAYSAIIDGQLTTIITGIILYFFGSGSVKGFAAVLVIGIITSVVTSIFITRLIFEDRLAKNKDITFYGDFSKKFLKNTKINFIDKRKISYTVSGILILVAICSVAFKGFSYGVDFSGGRTYVVRFDQPTTAESVRDAVNDVFSKAPDANNATAEVKQFGGASQMRITTNYLVDDLSQETDQKIESMLFEALKGHFSNDLTLDDFVSTLDNPNGIISSDRVDASIASEMQRDAIIAVILAWIAVFVYIAIRFRSWTWGLGGVSSLIHNTIILIGFYSLFTGILPITLDVDQQFIAAVLTIVGYSINDNVVIFDRIREYRALYPKRDLKQNMNDALNSTLSRTVNTSASTLLVLIAIAIFGGDSIRGFAIALAIGVLVGTYASIFIGTPITYDLNTKKEAKKLEK